MLWRLTIPCVNRYIKAFQMDSCTLCIDISVTGDRLNKLYSRTNSYMYVSAECSIRVVQDGQQIVNHNPTSECVTMLI